MLKTRIITAGILLPIVLCAFLYGPAWLVACLLLFCLAVALTEAAHLLLFASETRANIVRRASAEAEVSVPPRNIPLILALVALGLGATMYIASTSGQLNPGIVIVCLLAALLIGCFSSRDIDRAVLRGFAMCLALVYAALPWLSIWHLYKMESKAAFVILVMAVVWGSDTGAYFGGRYLGRKIFKERLLAPHMSPNKTWEGAFCGLVTGVVAAWIWNLVYSGGPKMSGTIFACAVLGGIVGQLGDLVESAIKRFARVKDSGRLLPGHGGFLDRVDAILFAAPTIWAILYYFH